jgi:hypothetical protein
VVFVESWGLGQVRGRLVARTPCLAGELFGEIQALGLWRHIGKNVVAKSCLFAGFAYKLRANSLCKPPRKPPALPLTNSFWTLLALGTLEDA